MPTKMMAAKIKAADGEGEGVFEAVVATYDPDSVGDRIVPGAFKATLDDWSTRAETGERMPVVWSHRHDDPFAHIGEVIEASETDDGLHVKGQLDLDNPTGRQVYKLIKGGRIRNWSFAYDPENDPETDDDGMNLLKQLKVYEVGPTLIGANQNTRTMAVKAAQGLKAGRVFSAKNEADLRAIKAAVDKLLAQVTSDEEPDDAEGQEDQEGKSQSAPPVKREESLGTKREEPTAFDPDDDHLAIAIENSITTKGVVA